jgi:hypothetical protein
MQEEAMQEEAMKKEATKVLCERPGWRVFDRGTSLRGWTSLTLERERSEPGRHVWRLGWDGARLARNGDAEALAACHPDIHAWLAEALKDTAPPPMGEELTFPGPNGAPARAVFHRGLVCFVTGLAYDFAAKAGRLDMGPISCCDMDGCIALFRAIDPSVTTIATFADGARDTRYEKVEGRWRAYVWDKKSGAEWDAACDENEGAQA